MKRQFCVIYNIQLLFLTTKKKETTKNNNVRFVLSVHSSSLFVRLLIPSKSMIVEFYKEFFARFYFTVVADSTH